MKNQFVGIFVLIFMSIISVHGQQLTIPLYPEGAPGFEDHRYDLEKSKDWWVKNIHNPSLTAYFAPEYNNTGTAVIICPGGGHRELVIDEEGTKAAQYLNSIGVTAFVLKYRLYREENSLYNQTHVYDDITKAFDILKERSEEWNINKNSIGMMGFSAGGEVVTMKAYEKNLNERPNFQILIYPGPMGIPEKVDADSPPAFMLAAIDDRCCSEPVITLIKAYKEAGVPAELHLFAKGGHGFNMGDRSEMVTLRRWPKRLGEWMKDNILPSHGN